LVVWISQQLITAPNTMRGTFEDGFPWIEIEVTGNSELVRRIPVIVDTGFNGYLMLPYSEAFPIGLTLDSIGSGRVADGNFSPHLNCIGTVICEGKRVRIVIDVQQNCRPLMGMALLKELGYTLTVDPVKETVMLTEAR
jgi:predicted aspartyl protease